MRLTIDNYEISISRKACMGSLPNNAESVFSVPLESHFSIPTVVYPKIAFGCPLFQNSWWFKAKWNIFSGINYQLSRCLSDVAR